MDCRKISRPETTKLLIYVSANLTPVDIFKYTWVYFLLSTDISFSW